MKKVLATILALVMALGVTTMAWAAETEGGITVQIGDGEKKSYSTLAGAIDAVNAVEEDNEVVLTLKAEETYTWTRYGGIKITRSNVEVNGNGASVTLQGNNTYAWIDNPAGGDKLIAAVVLVQGDNVTLRKLTVNATYPSNNVAAVGARKNSSSTDHITGLKLENVTANNQVGNTVGAICLQNVKGAEISRVKTQFKAVDGTNPDVQLSNSTLTVVGADNDLARGYITGDAASTVKLNDNVIVDVAGAAVEEQAVSMAPIEVKNGEDVRHFSSLRYALMNTASGSSVKLNGNVTVPDGAVTATCAAPNIVFDGQGHKITAAGRMYGTNPAIIASKGSSTFKNIEIEFKNSSNTATDNAIVTAIRVTGDDTVDNVKIAATEERDTTTINNMAVYGQNCAEGTTVTIKNCEFDGMFYGYYTEDQTKHDVVLENNTFNCPYVSVLYNTGKSTITGNAVNNAKLSIAKGDAIITDNVFKGTCHIKGYESEQTIKINNNSISTTSYIEFNEAPAEGKVDLTNNYWGGGAPTTGEKGQIRGGTDSVAQIAESAKKDYKTTWGNTPEQPPRYYYNSTPSISAVLNGSNKSATDYTSGDYGLVFRSTAAFSTFQGVQVDGKTLAKGNYTVEDNGGTEVYLKAAYLKTLAAGKHTVTILSTSGNAAMDFTIGGKTDSPKTFDAGVGIYAVTAVLSVTGMAWTAKKREN